MVCKEEENQVKSRSIEKKVVKSRNYGILYKVLKKGSKSGNIMERCILIRLQESFMTLFELEKRKWMEYFLDICYNRSAR